MAIVKPRCPKRYGGCNHFLEPAINPRNTDIERSITEIIVPNLAAMYGLQDLRSEYFICKNPACRWFYSATRKYFFYADQYSGEAHPSSWLARRGFGWPKPRKEKDVERDRQMMEEKEGKRDKQDDQSQNDGGQADEQEEQGEQEEPNQDETDEE